MRLHRRGVDQQLRRWPAGLGQGLEHARPYALGGPALEAIVQRLARAVDRWRVPPTATGDQHVDDTADHAPIINPRFAPRVGRKMRLKPRELPIRQPEIALSHRRSPFGDLESDFEEIGNPFYGSQP